MYDHHRWVRPACAGLLILLLAACGDDSPTDPVDQDLDELRDATESFQAFEASQDAGYTFLFMDMCMEDATAGGMGFHYVDTDLLDNSVEVAAPEALMYEPAAGGQLQLVGVEYVIPKDQWTSQTPPELFGQQFKLNAFDLWALHVWVWKDNPSGMFADWNPTVSCE